MLDVKTNYKELDKEFVFETNASIADKYNDNDAELLRDWAANQDTLSDDILQKCAEKVKLIVTKYVLEQEKRLKDKQNNEIIKDAIEIFKSLTIEDWENFTRKIKWKFSNLQNDVEFSLTISKIESLILKLPFNVDQDNLNSIWGILYRVVSLKSSETIWINRKLTLNELETILIGSGSKEDKWYLDIYEKWHEIKTINYFRVGEFYEIINAVRYCRRQNYLSGHNEHWINLLYFYVKKLQINDEFKREAIYEYIWLKFKPDGEFKLPNGDLFGCETHIKLYFADFKKFIKAKDLEDAQNLLNLVYTSSLMNKIKLTIKEINEWFEELFSEVAKKIESTEDPSEKCQLLEIAGTYHLFKNQRFPDKKRTNFLAYFEQILKIIDSADFYHAIRLGERVNKYIKMFVKIDPVNNSDIISDFERFSSQLDPFIQKKEGQYASAKQQIERGIYYLESNNPTLLLKALNYFHNAKDYYNTQESIEGYVLCLLNISQLYSAIGLNFAAKYYAIASIWVSFNNGEKKLYSRIADSFGMLFHCDFKLGAWLSAISDFNLFINLLHEFNPNPLNSEHDELVHKSIIDFSYLLFATNKLSAQFKDLITTTIQSMDYIGSEYIIPLLESMKNDEGTL